jgi:peroxiredoxin (alkyl hydroperoxide reductase subunit C)
MSKSTLPVQVGQPAPDFTAVAVMPDGEFKEGFRLSDYCGKYVVLCFYPLDFTFVCPTEILEFDRKLRSIREKGAEVIGVSVDSQFSHWAWRNTDDQ